MSEKKIWVFDTTLRDGAQSDGVSFSTGDKLDIFSKLCDFGVDFVEGGWPGSNPKDDEFFKLAKNVDSKNTELVAFGSTRKYDNSAENDANLNSLVDCETNWVCIFGKSWDFQVTDALCIPLEQNLEMIEDSVKFLKSKGKKVMFDAEHFFDGYKSNKDYAKSAINAAVKGGADWVVLCDTIGGSLPGFVTEATKDVVAMVDVPVGIHCHNDSDLATACTLAGVESGATMVQGTINGIGERCGNANLCSVIPNLAFKYGFEFSGIKMEEITNLSRFVGETANISGLENLPYVGDNAFAHKGGIHVSGIRKNTKTYEHVNPEVVGNKRRILISEMSGKSSIMEKLEDLGISTQINDDEKILDVIKKLESKGYQFEGADASFDLLVHRLRGHNVSPFAVMGFRLYIDENGKNGFTSEASIKIIDNEGNEEHTASEGNGPVNALDNALRKALVSLFPIISNVKLTDYKVRVLDEKRGTETTVRVLIKSTDGKSTWTTVGVSSNVIEASLTALVDSMEYAIVKNEIKKGN